jgi:hypothetical protein
MPDVPSSAPAGWFPDGSGQLRYWDGAASTQQAAPTTQPAAPHAQVPSAAEMAAMGISQKSDSRPAPIGRVPNASCAQAVRISEARRQRVEKIALCEEAA